MRTMTYHTPGAVRLNLEIPAGRIEIETSNTEDTRVELEALGGNELVRELIETARIDQLRRGEGHEIVVDAKMRHGFWFGRGPDVVLRVSCPHGAELDVRTKSADVEARGQFGSAEVKTASGDVSVEQSRGDVRVKTASGDVRLDDVHGGLGVNSASGDLFVGTVGRESNFQLVSGDLFIREAGDSVTANTISGDQRLEAVERGRMDLRAVSGDIVVGVRRGSRLFVDANTVSGSTSSELDLADAPGQEGAGEGPLVELFAKTISGDVRIERAPAPPQQAELTEQS